MEKEEAADLRAADLAVYQELTLWELRDHTASEQEGGSIGRELSEGYSPEQPCPFLTQICLAFTPKLNDTE